VNVPEEGVEEDEGVCESEGVSGSEGHVEEGVGTEGVEGVLTVTLSALRLGLGSGRRPDAVAVIEFAVLIIIQNFVRVVYLSNH